MYLFYGVGRCTQYFSSVLIHAVLELVGFHLSLSDIVGYPGKVFIYLYVHVHAIVCHVRISTFTQQATCQLVRWQPICIVTAILYPSKLLVSWQPSCILVNFFYRGNHLASSGSHCNHDV
jgi:hypothetical protein